MNRRIEPFHFPTVTAVLAMRALFLILFTLSFAAEVVATAQQPDLLIIEKDTLPLYANPLEAYFQKIGKRDLPDFVGCGSTACWRGYQAVWEIKGNQLYLLAVRSCTKGCGLAVQNANLEKLFGEKYGNQQVFADWVTDSLVAPYGKRLCYVHMGYASRYEKEKLILVKNGYVVSVKDYQNLVRDAKRLPRGDCEKVVQLFYQYLDKHISWKNLPKDEEGEWWEDAQITIRKDGTVKAKIIDPIDKEYGRELNRVFRKMRWEIVKQFDTPQEETFVMEIEFDFDKKQVRNPLNFEE